MDLLLNKLLFKDEVRVKFILVGIWNTIFGYLVFFVLDMIFENMFNKRYISYMSAMIFGQIIATINAFIFHKYVTFKSEVSGNGIILEFSRFCLTYVLTFFLSIIMLPFFVEMMLIHPRIAAAIIILICTVISIVGHSRFSFSKR